MYSSKTHTCPEATRNNRDLPNMTEWMSSGITHTHTDVLLVNLRCIHPSMAGTSQIYSPQFRFAPEATWKAVRLFEWTRKTFSCRDSSSREPLMLQAVMSIVSTEHLVSNAHLLCAFFRIVWHYCVAVSVFISVEEEVIVSCCFLTAVLLGEKQCHLVWNWVIFLTC